MEKVHTGMTNLEALTSKLKMSFKDDDEKPAKAEAKPIKKATNVKMAKKKTL